MSASAGVKPRPIEELDVRTQKLVRLALKARRRAYAPYSKSPVGCILVDERGRIHSGCNIENASYPVTLCAEPVALGKLVSRGGRSIRLIVVATSSEEPGFPCGQCRQMLVELGGQATVIAVNGRASVYRSVPMTELLPVAFTRSNLKR